MPTKRLLLEKLDGGLSLANPELLDDSECQAVLNMDFSAILGGFVTRQGTAKLNTAILTNVPQDLISNFKLYGSSGTSHRYTQAGTAQFRDFVAFKTGISSQRISAVGFRDQAFFSDGTNLWVDDGSSGTGYSWGITAPVNSLVVSSAAAPSVYVAHFDNTGTNSEAWTQVQGTQSFDGTTKKEGNQSLSIVADTSSFIGLSTLSLASATDLSSISGIPIKSMGYAQVWVYVSDASQLQGLTLKVDVGSGDFSQDYYTWNTDRVSVMEDIEDVRDQIEYRPDIPYGRYRRMLADRMMMRRNIPRNRFPITTNGWTQLNIPLTRFMRTGSTASKDWSTAKALMVSYVASSAITVKFDAWKFAGTWQTLGTGTYYWYETFQHRDAAGNLVNESNPSPISSGMANPGGAVLVISSNTTTSTFVTHRGFYRIGGNLDQAYQVGTKSYSTGTVTFTDTTADIDVLNTNIALATDNDAAPANYYWLEGPHYDRIFMGSGITLRWTKVNQPHSCPGTNTARLPGAQSGDTIQRIIKSMGRMFVYNYTSVYEFQGNSEDNFQFVRTLSRTGTPNGWTIVDAGDRMIYLGGLGSKTFGLYFHDGMIDRKVSFEKLEPFFTGRTSQGGVAPLNTAQVSKCSAAWYKNSYWLAYPSGTSTVCDSLLRIDLSHAVTGLGGVSGIPVSIYSYSLPANIVFLDLESIDGMLVAGASDGYLYQLETGTSDAGSGIVYSWHSKDFPISADKNRHPVWQVSADVDSQNQNLVFSQYSDSSLTNATLGTATTSGRKWTQYIKGETSQVAHRNLSLKISGTATSEVRIYGIQMDFIDYAQ